MTGPTPALPPVIIDLLERVKDGDTTALGYTPEGPVKSAWTVDPNLPAAPPDRFLVPSFQKVPIMEQQGGTCVGNSIAGAFMHRAFLEHGEVVSFDGEALNARVTHHHDEATSFRPVMDALLADGIMPREGGGLYFPKAYANVDWTDTDAIKAAVSTPGQMCVLATHLPDGWDHTPKVYAPAMPPSGGLHAMLIVGYEPEGLLVQNSWGRYFGDGGFIRLSWAFAASCFVEIMAVTDLDDTAGGYVQTYTPPTGTEWAVRKPGTKAVYLAEDNGRIWIKDIWQAKRMGVDVAHVAEPPATDEVWALPVIGPDAPREMR